MIDGHPTEPLYLCELHRWVEAKARDLSETDVGCPVDFVVDVGEIEDVPVNGRLVAASRSWTGQRKVTVLPAEGGDVEVFYLVGGHYVAVWR